MKTVLDTPRLRICPPAESHAPLVLAYLQRNQEFFRPWVPAYTPDEFTLQKQSQRLKERIRTLLAPGLSRFSGIFGKSRN